MIELGFEVGTEMAVVANLIFYGGSPHLLFICCTTGAHQPHLGLGVPDQNARKGPAQSLD